MIHLNSRKTYKMNKTYNLYNSIPSGRLNKKLVDDLLTFLTKNPKADDTLFDFLYKNLKNNPIDLLHLIGIINQKSKEKEKIANTDKRKHFGIYYTDYAIAKRLAQESIDKIDNKNLAEITFFEPCAGVGIFIIAFIDEILSRLKKVSPKLLQKIIDNIYYSDIDQDAIEIINKFLPLYIKSKYSIEIKINNKNYFIGDVLFDINNKDIKKNNPIDIFGQENKFDIILTNPPYKLLKANANKYHDGDCNKYLDEVNLLLKFIRDNKTYQYNEGTLNLYKIFLEEILENYSKDLGVIGVLIPMTLLNDQQSKSLRKRILENYSISKIYTIAEKNDFFPDISQSFTFFVVDKANKTDSIEIVSDVNSYEELNKKGHFINHDTIKNISESNPIIIENETGINILKKISRNKKIREFENILNLRGELDLTFHKDFITEKQTSLSLIKGANIKEFCIQDVNLHVNEDFLKKIGLKGGHTENRRIACQQISNIKSKKRLKFALVEKKFILGNSCNYIAIGNDLFGTEKSISLEYLLGLLNSDLMDWRFKLTNSNNHVSNYEISELPIIIPTQQQKSSIEKIVNQILLTKPQQRIQLIDSLNTLIYDLYGLSKEEIAYISK